VQWHQMVAFQSVFPACLPKRNWWLQQLKNVKNESPFWCC